VGAPDASGVFDGEWTGERRSRTSGVAAVAPMKVIIKDGVMTGFVEARMGIVEDIALKGVVDSDARVLVQGQNRRDYYYYWGQCRESKCNGEFSIVGKGCDTCVWHIERKP
jgi:hypothetical protein